MRNRLSGMMIGVGAAAAVASLWFTATSMSGQAPAAAPAARAQAQTPPYRAPRTWDGHPDINGIYQAFTTADWDILSHPSEAGPHPELMGVWGAQPGGQGVVEGDALPYRPEALAKKKANFENRMNPKVTNDPHRFDFGDPELQCFRSGVPRANYMPFPFQIFQNKDQIQVIYEYKGAIRTIYMEPHRDAANESWMGQANGHWEGETLVVENTDFNDHTWFDRAGNYHSDVLKVTERYTPTSPYHLQYEATIDDPKVFTRPWKMSFPLYRRLEPNIQLVEFNCVPMVEELIYGPMGLYRKAPK